jgi:Protein of unknown function (DUF2934)
MAKTARSKPTPNPAAESIRTRPTEEEIAVRAYHIYLERGETEGNPSDDWIQAERELTEISDSGAE